MKLREKKAYKLHISYDTWTTFNGIRIPHTEVYEEVFTNPKWACDYGNKVLRIVGLNFSIPYEFVLNRLKQRGKYTKSISTEGYTTKIEISLTAINPDPGKL